MLHWEMAFRVGEGSDFETRYQEVLSSVTIPTECTPDVSHAHDMALQLITDRSYQLPYMVYLNGTHDYETIPASTVNVSVQTTS